MQDTTRNDDRSTGEQTPLSANRFGLSGDDIEELLEDPGPDIDDLIAEVESGPDIEQLLEQDGGDIEDLLDEARANHYSELVARQWGTPEEEWWP